MAAALDCVFRMVAVVKKNELIAGVILGGVAAFIIASMAWSTIDSVREGSTEIETIVTILLLFVLVLIVSIVGLVGMWAWTA